MLLRLFTPALSLVHEVMHGIMTAFTGGTVTGMTLTSMTFVGGNSPLIWASGYWLEFLLYYFIWVVVGKSWASYVAFAVIIKGIGSYDFSHIAITYPNNTLVFLLVTTSLFLVGILAKNKEGAH